MQSWSPFELVGGVETKGFVGRQTEVEAVERALTFPGARLLLHGGRLTGKSSVLAQARSRLQAEKLPAVHVSFGAATNVSDMCTRLLRAASTQLRKSWGKRTAADVADRLGPLVTLAPDPVSGRPVATLDRGHRSAPVEEQRETLGAVLDTLDGMAAKRGKTFGIAIDDVHEIHRFGGIDAEWHLRGVIGRHNNTGYACTADTAAAKGHMLDSDRAYHGLFELLELEPLNAKEFGNWIDSRLKGAGVKCKRGLGADLVRQAGPRTGDVIRLAHRVFLLGRGEKVKARNLDAAVKSIVDDLDEQFSQEWSHLTGRQQNLLRALAAGELQPFAERVRRLYDLRSSAAVARTLELLIQKNLVAKSESGYAVVNPYHRRWIERTALPDLGAVPD